MELKHFAKLTNFGLLCKIICHVVHLLKVIFLCTNEQTVISSFSGIPQSIKTRSNFLRWSLSDQIRNRNSNKRICETFSCFSRLLSNYHLPQLAIKLQQTENSPDRWLFKPKYFFHLLWSFKRTHTSTCSKNIQRDFVMEIGKLF